jgi:hypothetical protein
MITSITSAYVSVIIASLIWMPIDYFKNKEKEGYQSFAFYIKKASTPFQLIVGVSAIYAFFWLYIFVYNFIR